MSGFDVEMSSTMTIPSNWLSDSLSSLLYLVRLYDSYCDIHCVRFWKYRLWIGRRDYTLNIIFKLGNPDNPSDNNTSLIYYYCKCKLLHGRDSTVSFTIIIWQVSELYILDSKLVSLNQTCMRWRNTEHTFLIQSPNSYIFSVMSIHLNLNLSAGQLAMK